MPSPKSNAAADRGLWDLVIVVVGLNLWVTFLLIPALHLRQRPWALLLLIALPLGVLAVGLLLRRGTVLLGAYPIALLAAAIAEPRLLGGNVYTPWIFALVCASLLGYSLSCALMLRLIARASDPAHGQRLAKRRFDAKWRRRRRMYAALAFLAAAMPLTLIYAIFLDPQVHENLDRFFPRRASGAAVLFGIFATCLWMAIFYLYFLSPLRAHVRGDPQVHGDLLRLRRALRRARPRPRFYFFVVASLLLMAALFYIR